ncbi:MAG: HEPN domain-containing protein [Desulfobacterium sp.]|nr:HEPN domain-containing protein [Desulfobacterium sp.]MBU3948884.1 HEPN domain-containing protein [Pseudomonadota bacterium]MBU4036473.1 HEPN domain-containing protein [Pseudomonadota bacterium]
MFVARRYIYVVFMCHLSIEKVLKGLYQKKLGTVPPKVHNLLFLIEAVGLTLPDDLYEAVFSLNRASIPTRYPEDLKQMQKNYPRRKTETLLVQSKEVLKWLKKELRK